MSKRNFNPIAHSKGGMGTLALGEDGTVLYTAYDVVTGEPVTVCLFFDEATFRSMQDAIASFSNILHNHTQEPDLTPADKDFMSILNDLKKPGKLH